MNPTPLTRRAASLRLIGLIALLSAPALRAAPARQMPDAYPAFLQALQRFDVAQKGESSAIDDSAQRFEALSHEFPGDPLPLVYAGAATTLRATTTWWPWRKMQFVEDGLARIDQALGRLGPDQDARRVRDTVTSLEVRFCAAATFLALPSMFHRTARGDRLLDEVRTSPLLSRCAAEFQAAVARKVAARTQEQQR